MYRRTFSDTYQFLIGNVRQEAEENEKEAKNMTQCINSS